MGSLIVKDKESIILIGPKPPPYGGIVSYCRDIINSNLNDIYEIILHNDNIPNRLRPKIQTSKNTFNIIRRDGLINTIKVLLFITKNYLSLLRKIFLTRPKIMHVLSTGGLGFYRNSLNILIGKILGIKTIFHVLGQIDDLYNSSNIFFKRAITSLLNLSSFVVVQSPGLENFLLHSANVRTKTANIFNGVDCEILNPNRQVASSSNQTKTLEVVTLGYLGFQKGTFDILKLADKCKNNKINVIFKIIGGGQVDIFNKLVKDKGLTEVVIIYGPLQDYQKNNILKTSDTFLLPSYAEGQPISILEAMAFGLPIISSTVGSIPEVVGPKNGFLVSPGDVEKLFQIIKNLHEDRELLETIANYNISDAFSKYQKRRVLNEINGIYKRLLME